MEESVQGQATKVIPMLAVDRLDRALAFYEGLLGGEVVYRYPETGDPEFVSLRLGESEIGIGPVSEQPLHGEQQRPASGHRIELCIYVAQLEAVIDTARQSGHRLLRDIEQQPWGERTAFLADPDGNVVMLAATD